MDCKCAVWMPYACLAAAHAELGEFPAAVEAQKEALSLTDQVPEEIRETIRARAKAALKLYEAGKPLRTRKLFLGKLSHRWLKAVMTASRKEDMPDVAE